MAWVMQKGLAVKSPIYLVENNQAVVPYSGLAAQTASGIQLKRDENGNVYWRVNDIDVTKYKTITLTYNITYNNAMFINFQINGSSAGSWDFNVTGTFTHTVDISAMTGKKQFTLFIDNNYGTTYLKSFKLEK